MKSIFEAIAAETPKVFAKIAAFSVALGVLSVGIFQAPYEIRQALPAEVFQAAQYISIMSWALNLFCIAQKKYEENDENESQTPNAK